MKRTTDDEPRDTSHQGQRVGKCPHRKTCGGTVLEVWRKTGWIEGKCDTCGGEFGYPTFFSIPAKGARL